MATPVEASCLQQSAKCQHKISTAVQAQRLPPQMKVKAQTLVP